MNYRNIYIKIIFKAKYEMKIGKRPASKYDKKNFKEYYEMHHILPRSLFKRWIKRKSNIVALTAREHFFCHQLLIKIWPSQEMYNAVIAFQRFKKLNSKQYEFIRKCCAERMKYLKLSKEGEIRRNTAAKGKHWYNNGIISIMAFKTPEGFKKGRLPKTKEESEHYKLAKQKAIDNWNEEQKEKYKKLQKEARKNWTEEQKNEWKLKHKNTNKGIPKSKKTIEKRLKTMREKKLFNNGLHWYNNGKINILSKDCPDGFKPGMKK